MKATLSDNTEIMVKLAWEDKKIDFNLIGKQILQGSVENYSEKVTATIKIAAKPIVKSTIIGYIDKVSNENYNKCLMFDDVLFLTGDDTIKAAMAEGNADFDENTGTYYVPDDYYTVNKEQKFKKYEISPDAQFYLLGYEMDKDGIGTINVEFTMFQMKVNGGVGSYIRNIILL